MIRIFTFVFLFVLVYIYITSKLYLYNMIVSLHEYALIFIIFDITLCFHVFLSISRRNREQLFEGFFCFPFIIPINIVNIIYFFLIKPSAILSSFVNFPICIVTAFFITLYSVFIMWSKMFVDGLGIFIYGFIFSFINCAVVLFYFDLVDSLGLSLVDRLYGSIFIYSIFYLFI